MTKQEARQLGIKHRNELSQSQMDSANASIYEWFTTSKDILRYDQFLIYVSYQNEVNTHSIIKTLLAMGKSVYCPLVCQKEIRFYQIASFGDLEEGYHSILEPSDDLPEFSFYYEHSNVHDDVLVVVPGTCFDRRGNRCGYGGGYYDRFLAAHPDLAAVALSFECQIVDEIDPDPFDYSIEQVITETWLTNGKVL